MDFPKSWDDLKVIELKLPILKAKSFVGHLPGCPAFYFLVFAA